MKEEEKIALPDLDPNDPIAKLLEDYEPTDLPEAMYASTIGGKSQYSATLRAQCVYLSCLFNPHKAASLLNVPYRTVVDWAKTDWWNEIELKLRSQAQKSLESKFTAILKKGAEMLEERLDNGDPKVLKDGTEVRQGVSAKDVALIICQVFDKRALTRGDPTSRTERTSTARDKLKNMAREMEQVAGKDEVKPVETEAVKH